MPVAVPVQVQAHGGADLDQCQRTCPAARGDLAEGRQQAGRAAHHVRLHQARVEHLRDVGAMLGHELAERRERLVVGRAHGLVGTEHVRVPGTQAMVRALNEWDPLLYVDLHVTDGIDYQYDITYGCNGPHGHSPAGSQWMHDVLLPALEQDLAAAGHIPGPLVFARNPRDVSAGLVNWTASQRYSNGYGDARHLPTLLVENHSLKPYDQRVLGTYVLLESTLRVLGEHGDALRDAIHTDRASRRPELPHSLDVVVRKLLEKAPEDRYQSASGVTSDLRCCRDHLGAPPSEFRPGLQDVRDRFAVPKKLYGRKRELQVLLDAFDHWHHDASRAHIQGAGQEVILCSRHTDHGNDVGRSTAGHQRADRLDAPARVFHVEDNELRAGLGCHARDPGRVELEDKRA